MRIDTLTIIDGGQTINFTFPCGTVFPELPDEGEVFFREDDKLLYIYKNGSWEVMPWTSGSSSGGTSARIIEAWSLDDITDAKNGDIAITRSADLISFRIQGSWVPFSTIVDDPRDVVSWQSGKLTLNQPFMTVMVAALNSSAPYSLLPCSLVGSKFFLTTNSSQVITFKITALNGGSSTQPVEVGTLTFQPGSHYGVFTQTWYTSTATMYDRVASRWSNDVTEQMSNTISKVFFEPQTGFGETVNLATSLRLYDFKDVR